MATKTNPQKKNSNSAVELNERAAVRYWPEDIIREILIRLPIKSILRFKSTNKTWYSLLRCRYFIDTHRLFNLIHKSHHNELFYNNAPAGNDHPCDGPHIISCFSSSSTTTNANADAKVFDLETLRIALLGDNIRPPLSIALELIHVLGPLSNGICCVIAEEFVEDKSTATYGDGYCNFAFCNLATREFNLLPRTNTSRDSSFGGISIDFVSNYTFGFGNIIHKKCGRNSIVDYKMVVIAQESLLHTFEAYVYSQRRGSWELIGDSNNPRGCAPYMVNEHGKVQFPKITQDLYWFSMQAYLHGSCHWMAKLPNSDYEYCVLYFDMENEVFGLMQAPPADDYVHILNSVVFVLDNHLAVLVIVRGTGHSLSLIDVWVMKEYGVGESWTKIHSCQIHLSGYYIDKFLGMSFSEDEDEDEDVDAVTRTIDRIFFAFKGNLVSCDRTSFRIHGDYKTWWSCWKTVGLSEYFETLEPLELEGVDEDNN